MADIWASRALEMNALVGWEDGMLIGGDSSHIQVGLQEPWVAHFRGNFSYGDYDSPFGALYDDSIFGRLNSYTTTYNGRVVVRVTELNLDAHVAAGYLFESNPGFYRFALSGADTFDLSDFGDYVLSYGGADVVHANGGNDRIDGGVGNDRLFGGSGSDVIQGGLGADTIRGGGGNDRIYAGTGQDVVSGSQGADTIVYRSSDDAGAGASRDVIEDFEGGIDHIDLSSVDANTRLRDDQAFGFIGAGHFTGVAGQLRYEGGIIQADTDGDRSVDFSLSISGQPRLSADDFVL